MVGIGEGGEGLTNIFRDEGGGGGRGYVRRGGVGKRRIMD